MTAFELVANAIFGDSAPLLCKWDNLKSLSDKSIIRTSFKFHTNIFKSLVRDRNSNIFFQWTINIKIIGGFSWLVYYLYKTQDFWFLLLLPISLIFTYIIEKFWYKRLFVTAGVMLIIYITYKYFHFNSQYFYYLSFIVLISSLIHSIYNVFLTEATYQSQEIFTMVFHADYIKQIYDEFKGVVYIIPKRPFIFH